MMGGVFDNLGLGAIAIGVFLTFFYGVYIKRKEVGPGMDTPMKRIAVYEAVGMGASFICAGLMFIIFFP